MLFLDRRSWTGQCHALAPPRAGNEPVLLRLDDGGLALEVGWDCDRLTDAAALLVLLVSSPGIYCPHFDFRRLTYLRILASPRRQPHHGSQLLDDRLSTPLKGLGRACLRHFQAPRAQCLEVFDNPVPLQSGEMDESAQKDRTVEGHVHKLKKPPALVHPPVQQGVFLERMEIIHPAWLHRERTGKLIRGEFPRSVRNVLFGKVALAYWRGEYVSHGAVDRAMGLCTSAGSAVGDETHKRLLAEHNEFLLGQQTIRYDPTCYTGPRCRPKPCYNFDDVLAVITLHG